MEALPGQEDAGERPLAQQAEQVEVVDRPADFDGLQLLLGEQGRGQVRRLQTQQTAQLGRLAGEARQKILGIDGVSRALADVVFFVEEVAGRPAAGQFGEDLEVGFDRPGPLAARPAVIEIDFDEFDQDHAPKGDGAVGREPGQVRRRRGFFPRLDERLHLRGEGVPGGGGVLGPGVPFGGGAVRLFFLRGSR